jgi:predicted metal-dependent hydrolase
LASEEIEVRVRRSPRARRVAVRIDEASGVELVLPLRASMAAGLRFLEARRDWVAAQCRALPPAIPFADGALIPLLGEPHRIRHIGGATRGRGPAVVVAAGEFLVTGEAPHLGRRIREHLTALARAEFQGRARLHAERVGRRVARVTVRDTSSRWGSCSADGHLSFSWRLVLAPAPVLDYVVAHEVAHLVHMNHGAGFWRLVESLAPDFARHRDWLRRNRARLMRYG